jgi:hypothetical protein
LSFLSASSLITFSIGLGLLVGWWFGVHYALKWHLFTLRDDMNYEGGWAKPDGLYIKFLLKTIVPGIAIILSFMVSFTCYFFLPHLMATLLSLIVILFGFYAAIRLSFILPATAYGHTPSISQIWGFSDGLALKVLWAPFRVLWPYLIAYFIYTMIVQGLNDFLSNQERYANAPENVSLVFSNLIPLIIKTFFQIVDAVINIFIGVFCVGVLSKYYLWGLDHRPEYVEAVE